MELKNEKKSNQKCRIEDKFLLWVCREICTSEWDKKMFLFSAENKTTFWLEFVVVGYIKFPIPIHPYNCNNYQTEKMLVYNNNFREKWMTVAEGEEKPMWETSLFFLHIVAEFHYICCPLRFLSMEENHPSCRWVCVSLFICGWAGCS